MKIMLLFLLASVVLVSGCASNPPSYPQSYVEGISQAASFSGYTSCKGFGGGESTSNVPSILNNPMGPSYSLDHAFWQSEAQKLGSIGNMYNYAANMKTVYNNDFSHTLRYYYQQDACPDDPNYPIGTCWCKAEILVMLLRGYGYSENDVFAVTSYNPQVQVNAHEYVALKYNGKWLPLDPTNMPTWDWFQTHTLEWEEQLNSNIISYMPQNVFNDLKTGWTQYPKLYATENGWFKDYTSNTYDKVCGWCIKSSCLPYSSYISIIYQK